MFSHTSPNSPAVPSLMPINEDRGNKIDNRELLCAMKNDSPKGTLSRVEMTISSYGQIPLPYNEKFFPPLDLPLFHEAHVGSGLARPLVLSEARGECNNVRVGGGREGDGGGGDVTL